LILIATVAVVVVVAIVVGAYLYTQRGKKSASDGHTDTSTAVNAVSYQSHLDGVQLHPAAPAVEEKKENEEEYL
jgi:anti-sigma-K factor RskA